MVFLVYCDNFIFNYCDLKKKKSFKLGLFKIPLFKSNNFSLELPNT